MELQDLAPKNRFINKNDSISSSVNKDGDSGIPDDKGKGRRKKKKSKLETGSIKSEKIKGNVKFGNEKEDHLHLPMNEEGANGSYNHSMVTCVQVLRSDLLEGFPVVLRHPVVRVHICSALSGEEIQYQQKKKKLSTIPQITRPSSQVTYYRSFHCKWNENLIFDVPFDLVTNPDEDAIIFFQIMDKASSKSIKFSDIGIEDSSKSRNQDESQEYKQENGDKKSIMKKIFSKNYADPWKTFAWAFLKVYGSRGRTNVGDNLRLQLYYPRKNSNVELKELHSWWKSGARNKYPSTLYVSVSSLEKTEGVIPLTIQNSKSRDGVSLEVSKNLFYEKLIQKRDSVNWDRKKYSQCQVPNVIDHMIKVESPGSLSVKFSPNGLMLACGVNDKIHIYDGITYTLLVKLSGHLGLVYDISWSKSGEEIVSVSSDCTARVWNLKEIARICLNEPKHSVLVHPSYVYCTRWLNIQDDRLVFVTGCFDNIIRVWTSTDDQFENFSCSQELDKHYGFVNALCVSDDVLTLYSGDSKGVMCVWDIDHYSIGKISFKKEIRLDEITGQVINFMDYHPSGHRLLVQTRNSQLRLVNHKVWKTTYFMQGPLNLTKQIKGCISPCGNLIFTGGEDSCITAWNAASGNICPGLPNIPYLGSLSCVDYHPLSHKIAVASFKISSEETNLMVQSSSIVILGFKNELSEESHTEYKSSQVSVLPLDKMSHDDSSESRNWQEISRSLIQKLDMVLEMTKK